MRKIAAIVVMALIPFGIARGTETPDTVFLEELTWTEVRAAIDSGTTTVIVPTAGTEQNGPHVVLGKHRYRMEAGSERIARELGDALVAPIITHVPEGNIHPPSGHMRFAGTISIPEDVFMGILEYSARSLAVHGFTDILFIGDSGGNQKGMKEVAEMLNAEWQNADARVHYITGWYYSTSFEDWLREQGYSDEVIGTHAGLSDTASLLASAPQHVRQHLLRPASDYETEGFNGDPSDATVELGEIGMDFLVADAVAQIRSMLASD